MPKRDGLGRGHAEKKKARIWLAIMAMFLLTNEQSLASRSTTISKDYGLRELSTTTRVTPRTLIGCGGGQRPIVNFLGPVRCPCFLHFVLGSSVDASWDVFFLPSSAFEQWELRGFAAEPSDYNLDYSFEGIRTSPASDSPTRELDESNVYVKGDYHLVFRAADDIERCFSKTSSYVFETMPSPCPVQTRIVGGSEPKNPESFKWIASIWFTNIKAVCGGSVIGPGYILTAAHCKIHESPSSFEVRIGGSTASSGKAFPVRRAWAHPDFRELSSGVALNDVAILEVDTSDEFNDDTSIAWNKDPSFPNTTSFVTAAGFGHISENWNALPVPNKLRRVDLPVVSVSKCATLYSSIDRDLHLCAGYLEGGCDSCQVSFTHSCDHSQVLLTREYIDLHESLSISFSLTSG